MLLLLHGHVHRRCHSACAFFVGLCRFCTMRYEVPSAGNLDNDCMHLTNHAVNRQNANGSFAAAPAADGGEANKWTLQALRWDSVSASGLCQNK